MGHRDRATFDGEELAVVLSHYELGVIESITEFPRGSRRSPKVGVVSERGKYVLKRRAAARARPHRVRFAHRVQKHLLAKAFPVAKLIPTRDQPQMHVQLKDHLYELFEFVAGQPYQQTAPEAQDAGVTLARFHKATEDFSSPPSLPIPSGDYHDAAGVRTGLCNIGSTLSSHDSFSGDEAELATLTQSLLETYDGAAEAANEAGLSSWPQSVIHSDWHPGNILFRKQKVIAVVDFDSVRVARQMVDTANGALQFSMIASGDPAKWPAELDEGRFEVFLSGYESLYPMSKQQRQAIPHLMAEALIAECVPPISETGSIGRWAGFRVLKMVRRKLSWLASHAERLTDVPPH